MLICVSDIFFNQYIRYYLINHIKCVEKLLSSESWMAFWYKSKVHMWPYNKKKAFMYRGKSKTKDVNCKNWFTVVEKERNMHYVQIEVVSTESGPHIRI